MNNEQQIPQKDLPLGTIIEITEIHPIDSFQGVEHIHIQGQQFEVVSGYIGLGMLRSLDPDAAGIISGDIYLMQDEGYPKYKIISKPNNDGDTIK